MKKCFIMRVCGALFLACALFSSSTAFSATPADPLPEYLSEDWDRLSKKLNKALDRRDRQSELPESSWFHTDRGSNAKAMNKLLDQAMEILLQGSALEIRARSSELKQKISDIGLKIDQLQNRKISAPSDSRIPWKETRNSLDERIADLRERRELCCSELAKLHTTLQETLAKSGLELNDGQVEVLLSSVTGDDLLNNVTIFTNVRLVVKKLESLARSDQNNADVNRRYTGMYLILNDILIHSQEQFVNKINSDYNVRLENIITEAATLRDEANRGARGTSYTQAQREAFRRNAAANSMTVRVARLYQKLLSAQRDDTVKKLSALRANRKLAENTYRTVCSSGDLKHLIKSGLTLFDSLSSLSVPALVPFENSQIRAEFDEINRRLTASGD